MTKVAAEWLDALGQPLNKVIVAQGDGTAAWDDAPPGAAATNLPLSTTFFDSAKPYLEVNSTTYVNVADFIYDGVSDFIPVQFKAIGSASGAGTTHECRLYDIYNNVEVAVVSWTDTPKSIYKVAISPANLPAGEAIFEIQVRKTGTAKSRIHYVSME